MRIKSDVEEEICQFRINICTIQFKSTTELVSCRFLGFPMSLCYVKGMLGDQLLTIKTVKYEIVFNMY